MRFFACGRGMGRFVPRHEQVLRLRARDGAFRAPAASRFPPDGEAASGGHISFCEERNVGKKVA